jgi:hypothetical protein
MSDLVEKVAKAIKVAQGRAHPASDFGYVHAHYAIKAVAEHIEAHCAHGSNTWFVAQRLRAQLKEGSE